MNSRIVRMQRSPSFRFYTSIILHHLPFSLKGKRNRSLSSHTHTHMCIRDIDTSRPNFSEQLLCKLLWKVDRVEEGSEITHPWLKVAPPLPFVNRNDTLLILSRRRVFHFEVVETGSRREISGGRINITKEIITKIYIYTFDDRSSFLPGTKSWRWKHQFGKAVR